MGAALEVLTGQVTNPGATVTAITPNTGDSFAVRSTDISADIELLDCWAWTNTNLLMRIRSPRLHDQAQNMRLQPTALKSFPLLANEASAKLYSQDNLIVELTGEAAAVDAASLLVYYNNLPGVSARLHSWAEIQPLVQQLTTVEVDLTSSATSCNYSATVALNANFDTLVRGLDYAVLGYECATAGVTFGMRGADTGNLRVGGPLLSEAYLTNNWFINQSAALGKPLIPVFNAANVGAIMCDMVAQAASTSFKVGINLAQLSRTIG